MRAALLIVLLAGCDEADPCTSFAGQTCIALRVNGTFPIDQLGVSMSGVFSERATPDPRRETPFSLPVAVAVLPGDPSGAQTLVVRGYQLGIAIGEGTTTVLVTPRQHTRAEVALVANGADLAGVDVAGVDLGQPGGDLARADLAASDAQVMPSKPVFPANQGLFGGSVQVLLSDFANGAVWAGTDGAGIFKSTDSGQNWTAVNEGLDGFYVTDLVTNNVTGAFYAGLMRANGTYGVFRRSIGDTTWKKLVDPPKPVGAILSTQTLLGNPRILVALTEDPGMLVSTDDGMTFTPSNAGLTDKAVTALAEDFINKRVFASTIGGKVFRSDDFGASWSDFSTGLTANALQAMTRDPNTNELVAGGFGTLLQRVPITGGTWSAYMPSPPPFSGVRAMEFFQSSSPDFYLATANGLFHLNGAKTTWSNRSAGITDSSNLNAVTIDRSSPSLVYAGTFYGGAFVSTNGGTSWSAANKGITNLSVQSLAVDPANPSTIYAGSQHAGVFKSTDGGVTWSLSNTGLPSNAGVDVAVGPSGIVFASTQDTDASGTTVAIFRSVNGGGMWTQFSSAAKAVVGLDPRDAMIVFAAGTTANLFKSVDGGMTYSPSAIGLTAAASTVVVDPNNSQIVYAGTLTAGVFKSGDGGASWTPASTGISETQVNRLAIQGSTILYAAGFNGLYRTTNAAGSWSPVAGGVTGKGWIVRDAPVDTQVVYAASSDGVFHSPDRGVSWTRLPTDPFVHTVRDVEIDPRSADTAWFAYVGGPGVLKTVTGGK